MSDYSATAYADAFPPNARTVPRRYGPHNITGCALGANSSPAMNACPVSRRTPPSR